MSNEFIIKANMYKELLDDGLITVEKYDEFLKHLVDKKANEQLAKTNPGQELKEKIASYEERNKKEYEQKQRDDMAKKDVDFAVAFLSKVYDSKGERVYSDEVLKDEKQMTIFKMQDLISQYEENAPEMYNKIIEQINGKEKFIADGVLNNPVEYNEEESKQNIEDFENWLDKKGFTAKEEESKVGVKEFGDFLEKHGVKDEEETVVEEPKEEVNQTPEEQKIEESKETALEEKDDSKEISEEMLGEPIKRKLISIKQAGNTLVNKIKESDKRIKSNIVKASLYIGAMIAGAVIAGPTGVAAAALGGVAVAATSSKSR